jgi:hypothetical protein
MASAEVQSLDLTGEEWALVGELLEREVRRLPVELRHTDLRKAREIIRQRLTLEETVLAKVRTILEG